MDNTSLVHAGVKGMKWGVRRYQNKDGSLTAAGKNRYVSSKKESSGKKSIDKKKIASMAIMTATVASAAVLYGTNPTVRNKVNNVLASTGKTTVKALREGSKKSIALGKKYTNEMVKSAKDGIKEGIKEAPKKATKAIVTGVVMNAAKRMMDQAVGKEETARIFKANNGKKIDSFWKVPTEDRDDE